MGAVPVSICVTTLLVLLLAGGLALAALARRLARTGRALRGANEALRTSRARTQAILDAATDGIVAIDSGGTIESMNAAAERIFGWREAELVAQPVTRLMPPPFAEEHAGYLANYLRTGVKKIIGIGREVIGQRRDGSTFPMELAVGEARQGGQQRFIGIIRDVTARKVAEQSLARQTEELARSNAELEQFAYVASHDLQEPLRAIASFSGLLTRRYAGRLDAQADEFIGFIESGARRMHELIADLLAFSRVSRRRVPFARVSSARALDEALENLQAALAEADPVIEREALPDVVADGVQLTLLFQNLVGNALKFRSPERPRLRVGAVRDGAEWRFSVRDNGIGIEPQFRERIFVIFQRLHTRDRYAGNGIGLAICRTIVERHGGRIWVESSAGNGSDFRFTIPIAGPVAGAGAHR